MAEYVGPYVIWLDPRLSLASRNMWLPAPRLTLFRVDAAGRLGMKMGPSSLLPRNGQSTDERNRQHWGVRVIIKLTELRSKHRKR